MIRFDREPAYRAHRPVACDADVAGAPQAHPRDPRRRSSGYFLFLRWIRVFFSSLRCFFFAIRLRRFLMTEPIRPPSLRHNGRRARHHSPAAGEAGHTPENVEVSVSANRSRSPLAYLLPRRGETDLASFGRRMPPPAPDGRTMNGSSWREPPRPLPGLPAEQPPLESVRADFRETGGLPGGNPVHRSWMLPTGRSPVLSSQNAAQAVPTKAARRYWLTACSGTRKERPTRMASSSPEWTSR